MQTQQEKDDFLKLITVNKAIIFKICNSYCSNKADREDLAQEIIYTLWKGAKTFNPDFKFSTWMYRVALNVAISFYRATKKLNNNVSFSETDLEIEDKRADPAFDEENVNLLQYQISILKEFDKALMILYFEEKSYKEIAEILGITETNAATKVNRIKEKMKQHIKSSKNNIMEDIELKKMWNSFNQNIDEAKILNLQSWAVNIKTFEYLQTHKAQSKLNSLSTLKKWAVALGVLWVIFLGLLVYGNHFQNLYFSVSVCILLFFSMTAIVVYIKHIVLIHKINFSESVVDAQIKLTRLQTSSITIIRLLWLQMPFYTTFFWSTKWLTSDYKFWLTAFPITLFFTFLSIWLYKNISLKNVNKKWFKILLNKEWTSLSSAQKYLDEIEEFKNDR